MSFEKLRGSHRIRYMPVHPHAECFDALQEEECIKRTHARPEVAKTVYSCLDDECDGPEDLGKDHAMVGRRGRAQHRELVRFPVEPSGIDDDSSDAVPVSTHELRQAMDDDVGSEVDRTA